MSVHDITYHNLLSKIVTEGNDRGDRTGTGTKSLFGPQMEFDLKDGFPLLTTKKVHTRAIIHELLWFLNGDTNNESLRKEGVKIWNEWAAEDGDLGPIYGKQWRHWVGENDTVYDQMRDVVNQIKINPRSRRLVVSAWNVADLPNEQFSPTENVAHGKMALAPCHCLFQFYVDGDELSMKLYQRSADMFLGVPFNIASYSLLLHIVAADAGLTPGKFIHTFGDAHIYQNHLTQDIVYEQLSRSATAPAPHLVFQRAKDIFSYTAEDFEFIGYEPQPAIKAPISV